MSLVLVASTGCEVFVRFDPTRLDGSADVQRARDGNADGASDVARVDADVFVSVDATDAARDVVDVLDATDSGLDVLDEGVDAVDASDNGSADVSDVIVIDATDAADVSGDVTDVSDAADAVDDTTDGADATCGGPGDCPGADTACGTRTCILGHCGMMFVAGGTRLATQVTGDCHANECDGAGAMINAVDNTDVPIDGNACTLDVCTAGTPSNPSALARTACSSGGTLCNGAGVCVQCIAPADCTGTDTDCHARSCVANVCGTANTAAGTAITTQTAGDCHTNRCDGTGGVTNVIDDTDVNNDGNACTSDVCTGGVSSNPATASGTVCGVGGAGRCDGTGICGECVTGADCPGSDTACHVRTCVARVCGVSNTAAGTVIASQAAGDCHRNICDGAGNISNSVDDTDLPVDGDPCTQDVCTTGVVSHPAAAAGTACTSGGTLCNGAGACVACNVRTDCAGTDTECHSRTCSVAGVCGTALAPNGTVVAAQSAGDCHQNRCDGAGNIANAVDDSDLPTDSNACTLDICTAGAPSHSPATMGTACNSGGGSVCNGMSTCVQCLAPTDCTGTDTDCHSRSCTAGACGTAFAPNGTATTAQTPGNCHTNHCDGAGNITNDVDDSDTPVDGNQCTSDVCTSGVASNPNTASGSVCTMSGVVCDGTGVCVQCNTGAQCPSGICTSHVCQPTCTDGVRDGVETGVDCGGGICGRCGVGQGCVTATDCVSRACNGTVCENTLLIVRAGDGVAGLTSAATQAFLERYSLTGTLIGTPTSLPTATVGVNRRFTISGSSTSEGGMALSADGRFVTLAGYDAMVGTLAVATTTAAVSPRVIARVDAALVIDTSTSLGTFFSANNVRSAASTNGTDLWASGSNSGVVYTTLGVTALAAVSTTFTNTRWLGVFQSQLYLSGSSGLLQGVATVGVGTPTTAGATTTQLPGFPGPGSPSPNGFVAIDTDATPGADRLYVGDDRSAVSGGGLQRWHLVAGSWALEYTLVVGSVGARGVAAFATTDPITLYATATDGRVVAITDTGMASVATTIVAAVANTAPRGITIAPNRP